MKLPPDSKWNITARFTKEEKKAAKTLCLDLGLGIGAWVAELMRMDMEAHEEGNLEKAKVVERYTKETNSKEE